MDALPVFMLFLERRRTENWEDLQKYWLHSREIYNIHPASYVGVDEARSPTAPVSIHDNDRPVMLGRYLNMITIYNLSQFHPLWEVPEDSGMVTERDEVKVPIYIYLISHTLFAVQALPGNKRAKGEEFNNVYTKFINIKEERKVVTLRPGNKKMAIDIRKTGVLLKPLQYKQSIQGAQALFALVAGTECRDSYTKSVNKTQLRERPHMS
ncbi:predicted protein [Coccidioides posadasii str. Silveira]|uniref:Predicted protein n=1 Tax=Coccidioides posadasii (strain RMSCC 757 / Silveira) TaxID=443226 RepID=E9D4B8_COCPS|nr:predicted protein [Coccidioides posadasii str. Silveira]